ncbi:glutathione peroxidase [Fusibacter ferrireducens]|uniref:Glutathione peroxidase n=1 Tax=Fusibacter ferrireducens TaxID=2785058 RepID=A0ABS0A0H5_9FIRM|nr:glutathione peroxidase [Fusibacter ferrireducens]MBF4695746.1 glutathione peroxidase [Fusibacter ferrireducens]
MKFYDFEAMTIDGEKVSMETYEGKVVVVVNTASKCGFTPQYQGLEKIYKQYGPEKFVILGFPCDQFAHQEPGNNEDIKNFCEINYGVTFPLFDKIDVKGEHAHPLFKYLSKEKGSLLGSEIKWNFTKFLIDAEGNVVKRYAPSTPPEKMILAIEKLLQPKV